MGKAERGQALPGWLNGSVKGLGNVCPLQRLKASIHNSVLPGILNPGPFFLRGLLVKNIPPTADMQLPLEEKSTHCSVKPCCSDTAVEMQESRRPFLPGNHSRAWLPAHDTRVSLLLGCLALRSTQQHPATEASGTLGYGS